MMTEALASFTAQGRTLVGKTRGRPYRHSYTNKCDEFRAPYNDGRNMDDLLDD